MFREAAITGVEFDLFWYDSVEEGVAYLFSWLGEPRSTVLVVWNDERPRAMAHPFTPTVPDGKPDSCYITNCDFITRLRPAWSPISRSPVNCTPPSSGSPRTVCSRK